MPHPDREHALQIELATALRERDTAEDRAHQLNSVALERGRQIAFERERFSETRKELNALKSERDALRAEVKRLRAVLAAGIGIHGEPCSAGEDCLFMREARAALAGGGDRG